jgi:C1A family cysteine protease
MSQFGYIPDKPDSRDYKLTRPPAEIVLPKSIDYSDKMSVVSNQFDEGTCVGFACADGMKEYQEDKEHGWAMNLSPRYVYRNAQLIDFFPDDEEGTSIRCAMKVLQDKGVCYESCWPYIPHVTGTPCKDADKQAEQFQIERYVRLNSIQEMKESLVVNGPFVAGVDVYLGFMDANGGVIPMPGEGEEPLGGHAICIVGYDDDKKRFKFKNSWGIIWGDSGYGYLSYDYMDKYGGDAWSAKDRLFPIPKPWYIRFWEWLMAGFQKLFPHKVMIPKTKVAKNAKV